MKPYELTPDEARRPVRFLLAGGDPKWSPQACAPRVRVRRERKGREVSPRQTVAR